MEKPNSNFVYFTQVPELNSVLVIKNNPELYVSILEKSIAEEHSKIKNIKLLTKKFLTNIKESKPSKIGLDFTSVPIFQYNYLKSKLKNINFVDISKELQKLRITKTEEEINLLKQSCKFADLLIEKAINFIQKSKTELEVKKLIEKEILSLNLTPSFTPIIASNINSKNPHHLSTNTKLKGFTIIDLGVKYKNYCSDITRTVFVGKPSKEEKLIYEKVLEVQKNSILENVSPKELNNNAQKILGKYLNHSLGHGIGIDIHELPSISQSSKDTFKENMVFTLEPGYYKKFGIRIEDDFILKNNKKLALTKSSKELLTI